VVACFQGQSGNDTEAGDEDYVDNSDLENAKDHRHFLAIDDGSKKQDSADRADVGKNIQLNLKPKTQPPSGMTVTIIREDGSTDPLHLEVTDYSVESGTGAVPVTVVQSTPPDARTENPTNIVQTDPATTGEVSTKLITTRCFMYKMKCFSVWKTLNILSSSFALAQS